MSGAAAAYAADVRPLPVKAPAPAAAYNWTGCYVGAGGGYGMSNQEIAVFRDGGVPFGPPNDNGGRGWFGTVQVGCDYQVGSNIVIGAFGRLRLQRHQRQHVGSAPPLSDVGEEKLKTSWAAGGRDRLASVRSSSWCSCPAATRRRGSTRSISLSDLNGVPIGVSACRSTPTTAGSSARGYEYGIGWLPGLFWKTEYRFADYGTDHVSVLATAFRTADSVELRKYVHTVRSELVWRFNFGGPVVARY